MNKKSSIFILFLAIGLMATVLPGACDPDYVGISEVEVPFNNLAGENPESLAFDSHGNLIVSMTLSGELRKVTPAGVHSTLAVLPVGPFDFSTFSGFMGAVAIDANDDFFVSLSSGNPADRGVWHITSAGVASLLATMPISSAPNGIALLGDTVYVADSIGGVVWTLPKTGGTATIWADDPLLKPIPGLPLPGPNGIQIFDTDVYVAVSATGRLVKIEITVSGLAGNITEHAVTAQGCDDFAFDIAGAIYCTTDLHQTILKILPDGTSSVLLDATDGLDGPTAVVFGRGSFEEHRTLYISNAAFPFPAPPGFPAPPNNGSSISKVELGMFGVPRYLLSN